MADDPKTSKTDEQDILSTAVQRYTLAWEAEQDNINEAYNDLKFVAGEQWPEELARERDAEKRPMLTISKVDQYIHQVTGDIRLNKPAIKVRPVGGGATVEMAEIFSGTIRNIEAQSDVTTVYVQSAESAARCGFGCMALETMYADDDAFEQDIRIVNVPDPLNVLFDPDARKPTREDAKWAFWVRSFTYDAFKERWPDAACTSWDDAKTLGHDDTWFNAREVRVAWYYVKKPETKELGLTAEGLVVDLSEEGSAVRKYIRKRKVESYKVCLYIMTAAEVLEGPIDWAGKYIPLIPVLGEEINVGERVVRKGVIRNAKDAQRLYNYHITTATEVHALAPKAPFIGTVDMFKGQEKTWRQANRRNLPYLAFNPDPKAPAMRPERSQPSTDISTSIALAQAANDDLHATTGIYPSALGQKSNEQSGKAIMARQRESDVGTYLYVDNLSKAIAYIGKQLVDLIPKIYDTARTVRILGEDEVEDIIGINQPIPGIMDKLENDLTVGKYDVAVETGPSFSTKRQEAAQGMLEFVAMNPQGAGVIMDLVAKNLDWPGADEMAERFKRMLPPGVDPEIDQQRLQEQGPPQPDPIQEATVVLAQSEAAKAQADAQAAGFKAQSEQAKTRATVEKSGAETEGIELDNAKKALELAMSSGQLTEIISQMVSQQLREMAQQP